MNKIQHCVSFLFFIFIATLSYGQSYSTDLTAQSACSGSNLEFLAIFGSSTNTHDDFQWTMSDGGGSDNATIAAGSGLVTGTTTGLTNNVSYSLGINTQDFGSFFVHTVTLTLTAPNVGSYNIQVQETNSATNSSSVTGTVNPNPVINVFNAVSACASATPTLSADVTVTNSNDFSYTWEVFTGPSPTQLATSTSTGTGSQQNVTATSAAMQTSYDNGTLRLTVTETTSQCSVEQDIANGLNVDAAPTITAQPAAADAFCSGGNVTLSVAANNATTYQWTGSTSGNVGTAASYNASTAETFTVTVGNDGCTAGSGAVVSDNSVISQSPALTIDNQPANGTVTAAGQSQSFSTTVTAGANRSIIWTLDGETLSDPMPGNNATDGTTAATSTVRISNEVDNSGNSYTYTIELINIAAGDLGKSIQASVTDECGTIVTNQAALPVDLVAFYGNSEQNYVELIWETASELNNEIFYIERSTDGVNFIEIGAVAGAGTSLEPNYYTFSDFTPVNGVNYYRLRQVDFDGTYEHSDIIEVETAIEATTVSIAPTASINQVQVILNTTYEKDLDVNIFDALGRNVTNLKLRAGTNLLPIDISKLQSGQYFIKLSNETEVFTKTFFRL